MQGPSRGGLYSWPLSSSPSLSRSPFTCLGECVSVNSWHLRFGNPALRIVSNVLSKHCLPAFSNKPSQVCPACQLGKMTRLHFGFLQSVSIAPLNILFLDVWALLQLFQ
jgi:hypothetical protein